MSSSYPATAAGTERYAARFARHHAGFYRKAQDLTVSSLGIGSYLGQMDEAASAGYIAAMKAAIGGGINFVDTSLNYRNQASERDIGQALSGVPREEVVVCTKAGNLVPGAVPKDILRPSDVVGNMHSMARAFLKDQLERSLANLRLQSVDVFYLHNPETQLQYVSPVEFYSEVRGAFETLESLAAEGKIRFYGAATWNGFRTQSDREGLSLVRMAEIATEVAGENHRFRFIQLPFNLAMLEAAAHPRETLQGQTMNTLEAAHRLGITVVASASLLQARLSRGLPEEVAARLPGAATDAQRAIQFTRSSPGIAVALVGMGQPEHVAENLGVAALAPADLSAWFTGTR